MKKNKLIMALALLAAFVLWTAAVTRIDVQAIGPQGSTVGFARLNGFFHRLTGVHMNLYILTDWAGLVPVAVALGFALLGLGQWIRRKHLLMVDRSILVLGGYYLAVLAVYVLFEIMVINRRPVLIDGFLEASYPSSTTVLVLCVMPTAILQMKERINHHAARRWTTGVMTAFTVLMVMGRLVSGVHWFSDIVGGVLISGGLVMMYQFICDIQAK